jgi:hypothetical protein
MRRDRGPRVEDPILRHAFFAEQVVRQGDSVCAIGKYDAGRSGIQVEKLEKGDGLLFPRLRAIGGGLMNFAGFTAVVVAAFAVFFAIVPLDERQPSPFEMRIEDLLDARIRQPVMRSGLLPVPLEPFAAELEPGEARGLFRTARGETIVKNAEAWRRDRDIDISLFKDSSRDPVAIITLTEAGELRSVVVGGEPFPAPAESFVFRRISGETIAGRLTWAKGNLPAAHVVFHTTISQVN